MTLYNFSPGPAQLPAEVHEHIRNDLNRRGGRIPLMEIGHRGDEFSKIAIKSEQTLRRLLNVPDDYEVLFLAGGASAQYAMVPLNLAHDERPLDYFDTGYWSQRSIAEAQRYGCVNLVAEAQATYDDESALCLPPIKEWQFSPNAAYCHFVDNETLTGFEFPCNLWSQCSGGRVLVADMTSNFLSRPFDINRFGAVYAAAQKNAGIAGLSVVIVHKELLGMELDFTPTLYRYATHAQAGSRYNTPPIFAWYVCSVMLEWIENEGGLDEMYRRSVERARRLYDCIDASGVYKNSVAARYRSRMNVHFRLSSKELEGLFFERAESEGLFGLRGHRAVGGIRASLYNGMPLAGADALVDFMRDFERSL